MAIDLQTVLIIIIILITINLLFVGFYIVKVLRDVSKAVKRAHEVIDDVDQTVKDGIEKVKAMERPLEALSATTQALSGAVKSIGGVGKSAMSILGDLRGRNTVADDKTLDTHNDLATDNLDLPQSDDHTHSGTGVHGHKEVSSLIGDSEEGAEESLTKKKKFLKPRFFRK
jgi:hypothetical protein